MSDALLVSSSFLPGRGGIESYLAELAEAVAPRLAAAAAEKRDGTLLSQLQLPYDTFGAPNRLLLPGRKALRHVTESARRANTDRILFGTPWPLVLLGPRLAERGLTYAVIVHGAEMTAPAAVPVVRTKLARALAGADLLLPVSAYTAERLEAFLRRAGQTVPPINLLRARVDLERFSPAADGVAARRRLGIAEDEKVLLCFGRLVKRKGVDRLIEALPDIAEKHPRTVVLVAGTGPELKRLRRLATGIGGGRVVFAGRVPDGEAAEVYASADVFVLPVVDRYKGLEMEGLGVVLLEASACEVPCVTGRSGGTPEAVLDGETGYVIDATDRSALVSSVVSLLDDPVSAAAMGRAGRKHVEREFSGDLPKALIDWLG